VFAECHVGKCKNASRNHARHNVGGMLIHIAGETRAPSISGRERKPEFASRGDWKTQFRQKKRSPDQIARDFHYSFWRSGESNRGDQDWRARWRPERAVPVAGEVTKGARPSRGDMAAVL